MMAYTAAVITISDKGFRGERVDTSGPNLVEILKEKGFEVTYTSMIPDDREMIKTELVKCADEMGIAVVMPNGHLSFYTDMHVGMPYFTFITKELPAICRSFFPNMSDKREDTFVAGLSMGGYGALKCGLRAPEVFSHAAALSACTDICELADGTGKLGPYPV